jgi:probable F420-dependent oxidoreductase
MAAGTSVLLANLGSLEQTLAAARRAEASGVGRVWLAETTGPDALVAAALIAREVDVEVGTAVVPIWTRSPAVLAMAAADVAAAGRGRRFHLGLGAGGQAIVERWHGLNFAGSVERLSDTIAILRQALAGERTDHRGGRASSTGFRLTSPPCPGLVSIYVGAIGPRMAEVASRAADGLILTWAPERDVTRRREALEAAVASGDRMEPARLVARLYASVTDGDPEPIRAAVREELVGYVLSPPYARSFIELGYAEDVQAVTAAFAAGDRRGSAAAISDAMLDELLVVGDAEAVRSAVARYRAAGADDVMVQPVAVDRGGDPVATIAAVGR